MNIDLTKLNFNREGLIPVVAQDAQTGAVLMLAWMNIDALEETLKTGQAVYFSRSRNEMWHKGATSGNTQRIVDVLFDCDADSLLIKVDPAGPACHNGTESCFTNEIVSV